MLCGHGSPSVGPRPAAEAAVAATATAAMAATATVAVPAAADSLSALSY